MTDEIQRMNAFKKMFHGESHKDVVKTTAQPYDRVLCHTPRNNGMTENALTAMPVTLHEDLIRNTAVRYA
jgi:hypothetical protein